MGILLIAALMGLIPAAIAQSKGHEFVRWWLYGSALFLVALPHSLLLRPNPKGIEDRQLNSGTLRKCPHCAEIIKREAVVCRYCGRDLPPNQRTITCERCGNRLVVGERFCAGCGTPNSSFSMPAYGLSTATPFPMHAPRSTLAKRRGVVRRILVPGAIVVSAIFVLAVLNQGSRRKATVQDLREQRAAYEAARAYLASTIRLDHLIIGAFSQSLVDREGGRYIVKIPTIGTFGTWYKCFVRDNRVESCSDAKPYSSTVVAAPAEYRNLHPLLVGDTVGIVGPAVWPCSPTETALKQTMMWRKLMLDERAPD